MNNFTFYNPTRIVFGENTISELSVLTRSYQKIMIIYGAGSIKRNGVYDQVKDALQGKNVVEFGGILPNPEYDTCMEAAKLAAREDADFLLSVGGGSVLDATKFMAAALKFNGDDPWAILEKGAAVDNAVPLGCVLTLPATGSEMNMNAVISRKSREQKLAFSSEKVMPEFSILDPQTTVTLNKRQTGNGVVDSFVHVMEQYLTYPVDTPLQDRQAEAILLTLIEEGPKALATPDDIKVRANIMWASTNALNHLIGSGVVQDWSTHMIGHEITVRFGLDHAQTLAIVLPAVMQHQKMQKREKLIQYGRRIWHLSADDTRVADQAISRTAQFFESMGLPTRLQDYNINVDDSLSIGKVIEDRNGKIGERGDMGAGEIEAILKLAK